MRPTIEVAGLLEQPHTSAAARSRSRPCMATCASSLPRAVALRRRVADDCPSAAASPSLHPQIAERRDRRRDMHVGGGLEGRPSRRAAKRQRSRAGPDSAQAGRMALEREGDPAVAAAPVVRPELALQRDPGLARRDEFDLLIAARPRSARAARSAKFDNSSWPSPMLSIARSRSIGMATGGSAQRASAALKSCPLAERMKLSSRGACLRA